MEHSREDDRNDGQALSYENFKKEREEFLKEKEEFEKEKEALYRKSKAENDRIKLEKTFFEKKFAILEQGFRSLAADKEQFQKEKKRFEQSMRYYYYEQSDSDDSVDESELLFFNGVTNLLGLKKRYKDLIKIYHPDNLFGDHNTILSITKEYEFMKNKLSYKSNKRKA